MDASTQVTLRVQVSDSALLENMTHLHVMALRQDSEDWVPTSEATLPVDKARWPLDIPIVPSSSASIAAPFEVIVEAHADDERLAQTRVVSGYARNSLRVLEVWLYQCPGHEPGFVCASDDCHGAECEACTVSGSCEPVPSSEQEDLPAFSATKTPEVKPAPGSENGAPVNEPDGCSVDNGGCSENTTCLDTPAGPLCGCNPGFADQKGDGTDCVDKCAMAGCDAHASCTIMDADGACTCTPPYVGNGKSCTFDERCSQLACDPHASCEMSGSDGMQCKCQPGYAGSGTACSNVDECKQMPSVCGANSTCTDSEGAYACACASGYLDSGNGCQLVDSNDCAANPCMNGGTCTDLVNDFSCKCAAGFSGERCESNVNDCAPSRCGTGGTCIDGVNTYTCKCASGYMASADQRSCTQINDCAGNPCGAGGSCVDGTNTYSCTCASGYSDTGTKSCVNIDDCVAGHACSPGGKCVDGIDSYSCQCDYQPITNGVPANSCRFSMRGDGTYDAQTGLSWSTLIYEIHRDTDTPEAGCQRQGEGRRPATAEEMRTVVEFDYFNVAFFSSGQKYCWATTTVDVCGPGDISGGATHALRCVRDGTGGS